MSKDHVMDCQAERTFLRRWWWVFPLAGIVVSALCACGLWVFVAADIHFWGCRLWKIVSPPFLFIPLAALLVPAVWQLGLWLEKRVGIAMRRWLVAPILAVVTALVVNGALGIPRVERMLWQSIPGRTESGDFFLREVAYVRSHNLSPSTRGEYEQKVIIAGSSQLLHGINYEGLAQGLTNAIPQRRAVAGMTPSKALAAFDALDVGKGDIVLMYFSELDFCGQDPLKVDWMRPLATPRNALAVVQCLSPHMRTERWQEVVDVLFAGWMNSWRLRDAVSHILFHIFGVSNKVSPHKADTAVAEAQAGSKANELEVTEEEWRAFEKLLQRYAESDAQLLVFEGQTNPRLQSARRKELRSNIRNKFEMLASRGTFTYIPVSAQRHVFNDPSEWKDMTHLTAKSRDRFTVYLVDFLNQHHSLSK